MNDKEKKLNQGIGGGLNPLPEDERDFKSHVVFGSIAPAEIPDVDFDVFYPLEIKDQADSDLCTAFAAAGVLESHEGVSLSPEFIFAQTKKIAGISWETWGANLRDVCKAVVKIGAIKKIDSPYTLLGAGRNFVANWNNWPENLEKRAAEHRQQSFFSVTGPYDTFDNIRARLWLDRGKKNLVLTGTVWEKEWTGIDNGVIDNESGPDSFGHAFYFTGQRIINGVPYLKAVLSNGTAIGDNGYFYFSRDVVNKKFTFGNFMFVDMPADVAKFLNDHNLTSSWVWLARVIVFIKNILSL